MRGRPASSALKSRSRVRWTANRTVWPATSGGYSMNSSLAPVQLVTSSVGTSGGAAAGGVPQAAVNPTASSTPAHDVLPLMALITESPIR